MFLLLGILVSTKQFAQQVPSAQENIACLVTFGINGDHSWGDDDFSQTVFFSIPKNQTTPFYIRVFDPETFGDLDEISNGWDTKIKYSIYGGKDSYYDKDARGINPIGNYKSGILIESRIFGSEAATDGKWISFGPFNPQQGELVSEFDSYVFKIVIDGLKGDDGNGYKLFLSVKNDDNIAMEGGNAFAYEYSVRLLEAKNSISHVYPYADNLITGFKIKTFGFDNDGDIKLYSSVKNGRIINTSNNKEWSIDSQPIVEKEKSKCLDLQIVKSGNSKNNFVICVTNEYDVPVPLFSKPLGGLPRYEYTLKILKTVKGSTK
ncbi:hypothetical protein [Aurantibacillus circumpalustris]|uniref:hypothetical protein n=1 Tax=Aurantibacillus circumpalustris TaxID=3036359 RepID=UPI00295B37D8|nr:hypothetical protein [Aurantibacillus circumpalustris]